MHKVEPSHLSVGCCGGHVWGGCPETGVGMPLVAQIKNLVILVLGGCPLDGAEVKKKWCQKSSCVGCCVVFLCCANLSNTTSEPVTAEKYGFLMWHHFILFSSFGKALYNPLQFIRVSFNPLSWPRHSGSVFTKEKFCVHLYSPIFCVKKLFLFIQQGDSHSFGRKWKNDQNWLQFGNRNTCDGITRSIFCIATLGLHWNWR